MTPDLGVPGSTSDPSPRKHYKGEALLLAALSLTNRLDGVTFEDCALRGPAVVYPLGRIVFEDCEWDAPANVVWWDRWPEEVTGVLALENCRFVRCRFFGVGFLGDKNLVALAQEHMPT